MGCIPCISGVIVVVLGATVPSTAGAQATPANAAPLTVSATCDANVQVIRAQIANKSQQPISLVLGFTAPKTLAQVVNAFDVFAIRPATGADEDYVYVNPKYALAEGAPWIVSLAPGTTHDVELPLRDFISTLNYSSLDPSVAGGARLVLEGRPAPKQSKPVWTGKIQTVLARCMESRVKS
jgi:hypothetical protein